MKILLSVAGLVLLLGLIGYAGYTYFSSPEGSPRALIQMQVRGASEEEMIASLSDSVADYNVTPGTIIELTEGGVPDRVIIQFIEDQSEQKKLRGADREPVISGVENK